MTRMMLTDAQWAKMEPHCLGRKSVPGRTGGDGRLFLEAVLWIARTGAPWRVNGGVKTSHVAAQ